MPDVFWYIVTVKGEAFTAIWKRRWIKISKDAYSWDDRNQAKDIAQALRKRYPSKSIRVASDKELAPWFVGEALEDEPAIVMGLKHFTLPMIRKIYPRLIAQNLVSVQPMTTPVPKGWRTK